MFKVLSATGNTVPKLYTVNVLGREEREKSWQEHNSTTLYIYINVNCKKDNNNNNNEIIHYLYYITTLCNE